MFKFEQGSQEGCVNSHNNIFNRVLSVIFITHNTILSLCVCMCVCMCVFVCVGVYPQTPSYWEELVQ